MNDSDSTENHNQTTDEKADGMTRRTSMALAAAVATFAAAFGMRSVGAFAQAKEEGKGDGKKKGEKPKERAMEN